MKELEALLLQQNANTNLSKKELLNISREKEKLDLTIGGIRTLGGIPDIIIVFDAVKDKLAILEANKLKIPVIGILDTNADPDLIDFPIPGNDDALRSINLYAALFKSTMIEAAKNMSFSDKEKDLKINQENKSSSDVKVAKEKDLKINQENKSSSDVKVAKEKDLKINQENKSSSDAETIKENET